MIEVSIGNKQYKVFEAKTLEDIKAGLTKYDKLSKDEGMLFYMDDEKTLLTFTMKGMKFPIDMFFINQDLEVVSAHPNCLPGQEEIVSTKEHLKEDDYIAYVLEVNPKSGIKVGDELEFEGDGPIMKVLAPDGSELMALWGGERIVSRRETKILIKKAKKAQQSQLEKDYKSLGKYIFKVIDKQDNREPEYVERPN